MCASVGLARASNVGSLRARRKARDWKMKGGATRVSEGGRKGSSKREREERAGRERDEETRERALYSALRALSLWESTSRNDYYWTVLQSRQ